MKNIRTTIASAAVATTVLFGGAGVALAQTTATSGTTTPTQASATRPDHAQHLATTLAPLVSAGTLTQAQADAVVKALAAAKPADGRGMGGPGMGRGMGGPGRGRHGDTIAQALGISTTDLETALRSGKSIAALAAEKGVAVQKVIDALVAVERTEHPTETVANITQRVTNMVNGVRPAGGRGGPGMGSGAAARTA